MTSPIPFMVQGNNIILFLDNKAQTINKETHPKFTEISDAIKNKEWHLLTDLVDCTKVITDYACGNVKITNGEVFWKGELMHGAITERMMDMIDGGYQIDALANFMDRINNNPSHRAINELYGFLEHNNLPITEDGYFLAYKRVSVANRDDKKHNIKEGDLVDTYTRTFRNNVGDFPEMVRNKVDDDKDRTCSTGLHFCSSEYLNRSGYSSNGITLVVSIDPADVVSIPTDYNHQKGRCFKYKVVDVHGRVVSDAPLENKKAPVQVDKTTDLFDTLTDVRNHMSNLLRGKYARSRKDKVSTSHKLAVDTDTGPVAVYFTDVDFTDFDIKLENANISSGPFRLYRKGDSVYIISKS